MSSLFKTFQTDSNREKDGIYVTFGDHRFLLARAGGNNAAYRRLLQAKMKPYQYQLDQGNMDDGDATRILAEVYSEAVIHRVECRPSKQADEKNTTKNLPPKLEGWLPGYFEDAESNLVEGNKTNLTNLLIALPDLFSALQDASGKSANFRREQEEADAKNS